MTGEPGVAGAGRAIPEEILLSEHVAHRFSQIEPLVGSVESVGHMFSATIAGKDR